MLSNLKSRCRILSLALFVVSGALIGFAGVSRVIQNQYKRDYENKAMFLKIPVFSERQYIHISGQNIQVDQGSGSPRYKVGDQLRVLLVDFGGEEIKFRMGGIATQGFVEIIFKFDSNLQESFPNRDVFDRALQATFTEGLKYTDIEDAKKGFVDDQFERAVREIAGSASISRESVLKNIAPHVPAYQDAQREIENLKERIQDISGQLSQSQAENRKLDSELKTQQAEVSRLKSANSALQEKIDNSMSQASKLQEELRDAKGTAQGYQKELANLQRSMNLKVDSTRDLAMQITELGQAMRKLQKENEGLGSQISSLRTNLEAQQAANSRLAGEAEELKAANRQMQSTISTLTSNEDSLARQYLNLKNAKEKLDDFSQSVGFLRTRIVEEKTEGGVYYGKASVYLRNVLLGYLDWSLPVHLNHGESGSGEAIFSTESIDYVRVTPEERHILRSLGERLKIGMDLISNSATVKIKPEKDESSHEIGERDRATWRWVIQNQGTQDARLILAARLINRSSDEIPLLQQEHSLLSSNVVRQVRSYLHPIPLVTGIVIGFLLFGIVGIFRRSKSQNAPRKRPAASDQNSYTGRKQL